MTTLIAKQLVYDPQKVQGTVITDKMLGFLINFVGIVPNVNHFIIILVMFQVYLVREGYALSKQIVRPKPVGKLNVRWIHKQTSIGLISNIWHLQQDFTSEQISIHSYRERNILKGWNMNNIKHQTSTTSTKCWKT